MHKTTSSNLFKIILTAILIALNIIIERFLSFNVWNQSIGLSFITIAFAAVYLGIPYAIAVGGFGDLIGALLFPFGPYFVGFTISNVLAAFITAIFIYKNTNIVNITASVIINKIAITVGLNSLWITLLYRGGHLDAYPAVVLGRLPQAGIMTVVEIAVLIILFHKKSKIRLSLDRIINL